MNLSFVLNGEDVEVDVRADEMLLDVLRDRVQLTSVRETCRIGVCGACTVLVDGEPISSCILLAPLVAGRAITTVDGLEEDNAVQRGFTEANAFQCGYCTPGMILTATSLLKEEPNPTDEQIRVAIGGNLCRCGCYVKIVDAVHVAAEHSTRGG